MNNTGCKKTEAALRNWEKEGKLLPDELVILEEHVKTCPRCEPRYSSLLLLVRKDSGLPAEELIPTEVLERRMDDEWAERVLARAEITRLNRNTLKRSSITPITKREKKYIFMAAASLILMAGMSLFFLLHNRPIYSGEISVRFVLTAPEAETVSLVGDFSDWNTTQFILQDPEDDGTWEISIKLIKGKIYTYNFLVDGEKWIVDPKSLINIKDGFGGESSLIEI